jgi:hypothetical protein
LVVSDESHDLRWFQMNQLEEVASEESLLRMGGRVRDQLVATAHEKMGSKPC